MKASLTKVKQSVVFSYISSLAQYGPLGLVSVRMGSVCYILVKLLPNALMRLSAPLPREICREFPVLITCLKGLLQQVEEHPRSPAAMVVAFSRGGGGGE